MTSISRNMYIDKFCDIVDTAINIKNHNQREAC